MDVSTLIWLSRKQTATTTWQISDNDYLTYLNIIYKDIFSRLATSTKKYTWQTYTTDVIKWQNEYVIPRRENDQTWINLVLEAFYNNNRINIYDSDIRRTLDETEEEKKNWTHYWVIRDWSLFIYPTPYENISNWLRIEWKYIPLDLALTDTEWDIKLASQHHWVLLSWLNSLVFAEKQVFDKEQLKRQEYEQWIQNIK